MYFISRNNKIYSYIAHTSLKRCYMATLMAVCAFFIIGVYGVYYPLCAHIMLLQSERVMLQNKFDAIGQLGKNNEELSLSIESGKKSIDESAIALGKHAEHCHERMLFVLDTVTKLGLTLKTYGSCNTKDKEWYIKNSAHFDIVGPLQKIMTFFETVKNSRSMITISHATITRVDNDIFQLSCDAGVVMIKK